MSKKTSPEAQEEQDGGWCRWLGCSQSISALLFWHGEGMGGKQVEEPEPKIKKGNPRGTVCRGTSAIFQLQTGALNTLTEQQQRLFQTQRYFVPALFSVFGPEVRWHTHFYFYTPTSQETQTFPTRNTWNIKTNKLALLKFDQRFKI